MMKHNMRAALAAAAVMTMSAATTVHAQVVQVRQFKGASTISVVAWSPSDPNYGLRAEVRADGNFAGDDRRGEHRLYLGSIFVKNNGGSGVAWSESGKKLRVTPTKTDEDACKYGACSPTETDGFAVPDAVLRNAKDGLGVSFDGATGKAWNIRVRGDVVAAYLRTLDSLSTAMKSKK